MPQRYGGWPMELRHLRYSLKSPRNEASRSLPGYGCLQRSLLSAARIRALEDEVGTQLLWKATCTVLALTWSRGIDGHSDTRGGPAACLREKFPALIGHVHSGVTRPLLTWS
jgi:hypothetical protein